MADHIMRRVLVLANPRSGVAWSFDSIRRGMDTHWESTSDVCYQFTQGVEDALEKAQRAVDGGFDTILVLGGDGTVNTVGRILLNTEVSLGVIPVGSGNGFARHFNIPLDPERAVEALAGAAVKRIDVGLVNDKPFLVTCSMAWDASLVRSFNKYPVRGVLPYVFAGVQEFFDFRPQPMEAVLDGGESLMLQDAMVCTVANLSQFGGGARIAPQAQHDDGWLELVVAMKQDAPVLFANILRLFDGSLSSVPQVTTRRFRTLTVRRQETAPIQIDGELVEVGRDVEVRVLPASLRVLVPSNAARV